VSAIKTKTNNNGWLKHAARGVNILAEIQIGGSKIGVSVHSSPKRQMPIESDQSCGCFLGRDSGHRAARHSD
jgi:hypothetical protein